jgi:hypothetical protein
MRLISSRVKYGTIEKAFVRLLCTHDGKAILFVVGKGRKPRMVACPNTLAHQLKSYAYEQGIETDGRFFDINRLRPRTP